MNLIEYINITNIIEQISLLKRLVYSPRRFKFSTHFNSLVVFYLTHFERYVNIKIKVFSFGASYSQVGLKGLFSSLYFNPLIKAAVLSISRTLLCTLNDALNSPNKRLLAFSPARS